MKSVLFFLICSFVISSAMAQVDASVWNNITKQEDNKYILSMPNGWKKVTIADASGFDYKFDFSGIGLPSNAGNAPLYANFTISHIAGDKTGQAKDQAVAEFSGFADRVTEPGYNLDSSAAAVKTGQQGNLIHTRYYRRSKVSNYSKYYFIVYYPRTNETYTLTFNFQYKDATYAVEHSAQFKDYVTNVLSRFEFR